MKRWPHAHRKSASIQRGQGGGQKGLLLSGFEAGKPRIVGVHACIG